jgi:hypothetical protein
MGEPCRILLKKWQQSTSASAQHAAEATENQQDYVEQGDGQQKAEKTSPLPCSVLIGNAFERSSCIERRMTVSFQLEEPGFRKESERKKHESPALHEDAAGSHDGCLIENTKELNGEKQGLNGEIQH